LLARNGERPATDGTVNRARIDLGAGKHRLSSRTLKKSLAAPICAAEIIGSGHPDTKRSLKSPVAHLSGHRLGEESDDYPTIARLNDRWRVIVCKHSIQWILQRRRGGANHWRGYWFCRTREALIRGAREHAGQIDGISLAILLRLPERIGGAS
jgi:hypothetical protein